MKARACEEIKTGRNKMLQRDNAENTVTVRHCWVHTDQSIKIFILKAQTRQDNERERERESERQDKNIKMT